MRCSNRRSKGVTLIELMVGLTVGLLLMLAVTRLYLVGREAALAGEALAEQAQRMTFLATLLGDEVRRAGFSDGLPLEGDGLVGGDHYLTVRYRASHDCLGHASAQPRHTWSVATDGTLRCDNGVQRHAVLDGVEVLQLSYLPRTGDDFVAASQIDDWDGVRAVRFEIVLAGDPPRPFHFMAARRN